MTSIFLPMRPQLEINSLRMISTVNLRMEQYNTDGIPTLVKQYVKVLTNMQERTMRFQMMVVRLGQKLVNTVSDN